MLFIKKRLTASAIALIIGISVLAPISAVTVSADGYIDYYDYVIKSDTDGSIPNDIHSLIEWVLRESYLSTNQELSFYAKKVRHFNEVKKAVRQQLEVYREIQTSLGIIEEEKSLISYIQILASTIELKLDCSNSHTLCIEVQD